jgi:hypothetical protein
MIRILIVRRNLTAADSTKVEVDHLYRYTILLLVRMRKRKNNMSVRALAKSKRTPERQLQSGIPPQREYRRYGHER